MGVRQLGAGLLLGLPMSMSIFYARLWLCLCVCVCGGGITTHIHKYVHTFGIPTRKINGIVCYIALCWAPEYLSRPARPRPASPCIACLFSWFVFRFSVLFYIPFSLCCFFLFFVFCLLQLSFGFRPNERRHRRQILQILLLLSLSLSLTVSVSVSLSLSLRLPPQYPFDSCPCPSTVLMLLTRLTYLLMALCTVRHSLVGCVEGGAGQVRAVCEGVMAESDERILRIASRTNSSCSAERHCKKLRHPIEALKLLPRK